MATLAAAELPPPPKLMPSLPFSIMSPSTVISFSTLTQFAVWKFPFYIHIYIFFVVVIFHFSFLCFYFPLSINKFPLAKANSEKENR